MSSEHIVVVCSWQDCPFVADVTKRFAEDHGLTAREQDVLKLVVDGLVPDDIASQLVISKGTVKSHLHRIYQKVSVSGRADLMRVFGAYGRGLT